MLRITKMLNLPINCVNVSTIVVFIVDYPNAWDYIKSQYTSNM